MVDPVDEPVSKRLALGGGLGTLGLSGEFGDPQAVDVVALAVEGDGHVEGMAGSHDVGDGGVERDSV